MNVSTQQGGYKTLSRKSRNPDFAFVFNNELPARENLLKSPAFTPNVHEHFTWPNDPQFRRATLDGVRRDWTCVRALFDCGGHAFTVGN
jgi:hypothetical protein